MLPTVTSNVTTQLIELLCVITVTVLLLKYYIIIIQVSFVELPC